MPNYCIMNDTGNFNSNLHFWQYLDRVYNSTAGHPSAVIFIKTVAQFFHNEIFRDGDHI